MSRKRILFLASWYPSENNPNLGNFVQRHAEAANEHSDVTALFITSSKKYKELSIQRENSNGVDTYIVYYPKLYPGNGLLTALRKYKRYLAAAKYAFNQMEKTFDLVHLNIAYPAGLFALWLKKHKGIPYVLTEQWTGYLPIKGDFEKLNSVVRLQHKKIFQQAAAVFPVSDHLGKALQQKKLIKSYTAIHNVVNDAIFYPSEQQPKTFRFIHISTFDDAHKNVSGMFRAFAHMVKEGLAFEVEIVTEGEKENVQLLAEQYGFPKDRLFIASSLNQEGVAAALRRSNCLVLFSNYETFSVVLAEAWMTGIPCVYSKCGGLTEIDNPEIGVQVPIKGEEELISALRKILQEDIRFSREVITEFARDFSKEKVALNLCRLYESAGK